MSVFTLAISCLTTSNLPWFMDLTFQVPMQYCSFQHGIWLPSPVTSTMGCCFCFGSVSSFFLEKAMAWLRDFPFTFHFHALEKEMTTHSSVLAWRIPGMGEPGRLLSMGLHRVRHDWSDLVSAASFFLEFFLYWSPVAYWAPTDLGSSSFSVLSFCLFILSVGFSRQGYWSGLPFPFQQTTFCQNSPPWHICLRWPYMAWLIVSLI